MFKFVLTCFLWRYSWRYIRHQINGKIWLSTFPCVSRTGTVHKIFIFFWGGAVSSLSSFLSPLFHASMGWTVHVVVVILHVGLPWLHVPSSSILSAISTWSSAYSNSQGSPVLNSLESASSTMIKSNGLSTDPWWTPILTGKGSPMVPLILTVLFAFSYITFSMPMLLPVVELYRMPSRSTKVKYKSFFSARNLSCITSVHENTIHLTHCTHARRPMHTFPSVVTHK